MLLSDQVSSVLFQLHSGISEIDVSNVLMRVTLLIIISENSVAEFLTSYYCASQAAVGFKILGLSSDSLLCHIWC